MQVAKDMAELCKRTRKALELITKEWSKLTHSNAELIVKLQQAESKLQEVEQQLQEIRQCHSTYP